MAVARKARDIMQTDYPAVDKDETLEHAVRVMKKYDSDRVLAFEDERLVGIMTKKDIMIKLATTRTWNVAIGRMHVSSFMTPDPKTVEPETDVGVVAQRMVDENVGSFPVAENGKVVGLVTRWEIANLAGEVGADVKAVDVMVTVPEVLRTTNKVLHARQLLLRYNVLFLPVLDEEGRLVGYITVDEIADAFLAFHDIVPEKYRKERIEHLLVDDIMRLRPPTVTPDSSVAEVLDKMKVKKSKGVVVVHEGKLVGIITLNELVKLVAMRSQ
ncbi:CBS domain-containing protein [Pyrodictium abyssi]|uniref:CBS domain-containing protein n=1 Tax=Pyrodictium abyssi TaxID=54256 RepID=A0ABM8IZC1_9CREN|nr:CBS domain-containing protein [Pyrodictium abyssi]